FQAEDGIRDRTVTESDVCSSDLAHAGDGQGGAPSHPRADDAAGRRCGPAVKGLHERRLSGGDRSILRQAPGTMEGPVTPLYRPRSEERRVGKECRWRWARER